MVDRVDGRGGKGGSLDRRALAQIYREEAPRLARYFRKQLRSRQEAMDLVQDAFVRLAVSAPETGHRRPAAYLQRIARNLLVDRARLAATRLAQDHLPIQDHTDIAVAPAQAEEIELRDVMRLYRQALAALPARTRDIFTMHRRDELTYVEIAARLNISVPTVQYHIARALTYIDSVLDRE